MLPCKFLKIDIYCNGHFSAFEQFSGNFCLCFWPLILSASPNMMHFVRTVSIMRAEGDSGIL